MTSSRVIVSKVVIHPTSGLHSVAEAASDAKFTSAQSRAISTPPVASSWSIPKERLVGDVNPKICKNVAKITPPGGEPDADVSGTFAPRIMRSAHGESAKAAHAAKSFVSSYIVGDTKFVAATPVTPLAASNGSRADTMQTRSTSTPSAARTSSRVSTTYRPATYSRIGGSVTGELTADRSPRTRSAYIQAYLDHCATMSTAQSQNSPSSAQSKRHKASASAPLRRCPTQAMEVSVLNLRGCAFDPVQPFVKCLLLRALGLGEEAHVEQMRGNSGGLNDGVWFVRSAAEELVLKLVNGVSAHPAVPTEAENALRISQAHPLIIHDRELAFPHKVLHLQEHAARKPQDVIVMKRAPGVRLQEAITTRMNNGRRSELLPIFDAVGACVARFHCRYGNKQHCDLSAANVMYNESDGQVTLIDLGGMGDPQVHAKDVDHFPKSIDLLTKHYGPHIADELMQQFWCGYKRSTTSR